MLAASAALVLGVTACASAAPAAVEDNNAVVQPADAGSAESSDDAGGDYAFGTDRDQIATAIEQAFSGSNGTARWDGAVFVLEVDGDADSPLAGFMECRVLDELLLEEDLARVQYPNGSLDCAEVLAD